MIPSQGMLWAGYVGERTGLFGVTPRPPEYGHQIMSDEMEADQGRIGDTLRHQGIHDHTWIVKNRISACEKAFHTGIEPPPILA